MSEFGFVSYSAILEIKILRHSSRLWMTNVLSSQRAMLSYAIAIPSISNS